MKHIKCSKGIENSRLDMKNLDGINLLIIILIHSLLGIVVLILNNLKIIMVENRITVTSIMLIITMSIYKNILIY